MDFSSMFVTPLSTAGTLFAGSLLAYVISTQVWASRQSKSMATRQEESIRVGILGAGAVGVIAGLKLLPVLHEKLVTESTPTTPRIEKVVLVGRSTLQNALEQRNGKIEIHENFGGGVTSEFDVSSRPDIEVSDDITALKDCQVILIAVKTIATQTVAEQLAKILPEMANTTILSLQNGVFNAQVLETVFHHDNTHKNIQVLTTVVAFPAEWEEGSTNFHLNIKSGFLVEPPSSQGEDRNTTALHTQRVHALVQQWTRQGLPSKVTDKIHLIKCFKLFTNLANPVNALAGCPVPTQFRDRDHRLVWAAAIQEGAKILSHPNNSQRLGLDDVWLGRWLVQIMGGTVIPGLMKSLPDACFAWLLSRPSIGPNYKSSMLQDLERRRPKTEMGDLSGALVILAKSTDLPVNTAMIRLIREAEEKRVGSPCLSGKQLLQEVGIVA